MSQGSRPTLEQIQREFRMLREQAERALAQVDDNGFTASIDADSNSLAVIVKHLAGNLRSRWTDPLTTDGEKPDRQRDGEFALTADDTRERLLTAWAEAFAIVDRALDPLTDADLDAPVVIRGQAQSLRSALLRSLTHLAGHVGQIVLLARHVAGASWTTLSIPRGQSEAFLRAVRSGERPDRPFDTGARRR